MRLEDGCDFGWKGPDLLDPTHDNKVRYRRCFLRRYPTYGSVVLDQVALLSPIEPEYQISIVSFMCISVQCILEFCNHVCSTAELIVRRFASHAVILLEPRGNLAGRSYVLVCSGRLLLVERLISSCTSSVMSC